MQNQTVFLRLQNKTIIAVYPVTDPVDGKKSTAHPLVPAYASTICNAQDKIKKRSYCG